MEQYWMPKELDLKNLRYCIDMYHPTYLFIRDCGGFREDGTYSAQGRMKVSEDLIGRDLDYRKDGSGLTMLIDSEEVFRFPLEDYPKGFSVAYERIEQTEDGIGRMVMLSHGTDPYDPTLPKPTRSILRTVLDDHLMEIEFDGRINLRPHSWLKKPDWKYWTVDTPYANGDAAKKG